ncbi:hypothetical protein Xbed_01968 [Xenorhabdus beddingii]|uniref:Uncharacterized protein n=1 Tax=Xenorhabdus beddingii TaxID=40578 RepID=A0A1Y2SNW3_9GAMM|nr:hypothetical protein Xbed_01968 [Xenorhabdus beddingii]
MDKNNVIIYIGIITERAKNAFFDDSDSLIN